MLKLKDGYYAKDSDGCINYYDTKPDIYMSWWTNGDSDQPALCIDITEPWNTSLYYVKDGVATKVVTFTKDQKVLVRDSPTNTWKRRYYSHEEKGKHYVYEAGANSWVGNDVVRCHYIKPYIEGEDE